MAKIKIEIDETAKDVELFKSLKSITLEKSELFKYAIMMWEVPSHVVGSDFDHLQSKVPHLEAMLTDFINFDEDQINNLSVDDRVKKIVSEALGVGIGLKYAVELLKTNPNKFKKIEPIKDGKYLDYSTIIGNKEYEIETKGTTNKYYTSFKDDIISKKKDSESKKVHLRMGTIAMFCNKGDKRASKCVIVDDPPENIINERDDTFKTQLLTYASFLSHIFESKYYNKYIRPIQNDTLDKVQINENKFFGKYLFEGNEYLGEYFDYRLIKGNIENLNSSARTAKGYFKSLTKKIGKTKIFIGLDKDVIDAINRKDEEFLYQYSSKQKKQEFKNKSLFLDIDGIIIVKSKNGSDKQIERFMSEEEVFSRMGLYSAYRRGQTHRCGAPCRSRELAGKPCDIKTYRGNCHFHR
ncbi:hypothetical protein [Flavivirga algicola]|uniref:hypothetical protein n=1 Tax=Flavivirga algicola TaxID=2729136 RepID=UPI0019823B03|nr:hypothetical protein [Flavivirga algicola]